MFSRLLGITPDYPICSKTRTSCDCVCASNCDDQGYTGIKVCQDFDYYYPDIECSDTYLGSCCNC